MASPRRWERARYPTTGEDDRKARLPAAASGWSAADLPPKYKRAGQNVGTPSIDVHARNREYQGYQRAQDDKKLLHGI
jgi:hypothetical protein